MEKGSLNANKPKPDDFALSWENEPLYFPRKTNSATGGRFNPSLPLEDCQSLEIRKTEQQKNLYKEQTQKLVNEYNSIGQAKNPLKGSLLQSSKAILQREYAISSDQSPILYTFGLATCVGVALYNPQTKQAALAHIDAFTSKDSIIEFLFCLGDQPCHAHISGGEEIWYEIASDIMTLLSHSKHIKIQSCKIISEEIQSLGINAQTGEYYTFIPDSAMKNIPEFIERMNKTVCKESPLVKK